MAHLEWRKGLLLPLPVVAAVAAAVAAAAGRALRPLVPFLQTPIPWCRAGLVCLEAECLLLFRAAHFLYVSRSTTPAHRGTPLPLAAVALEVFFAHTWEAHTPIFLRAFHHFRAFLLALPPTATTPQPR